MVLAYRTRLCILTFALSLLPPQARADVGKVSTPEVTRGKLEFEYIGVRYGDSDPAENNHQDHRIDINYSPSDRLRAGMELNGKDEPGTTGFTSKNIAAKARYEMTSQNDWWLGSAMDLKYAFATHDGKADGLSGKLLLQRKEGPYRVVANLGWSRGVGPHRDDGIGGAHAVQGLYQLGDGRYAGIEWQADTVRVFELSGSDAAHYVGPVITGNVAKWNATALTGVLSYGFGVSDAAHDDALRLQLALVRYF